MLLWIEGFDNFGTSLGNAPSPTGVVGRKYPTIVTENMIDVKSGRLGGYAFLLGQTTCYMQSPPLTTDATLIVGLALKFGSWTSSTAPFLAFYDGATLGMNVCITATGQITVRRGTTVLATTTDAGIFTGAWFYLEFKVLCNATTGTYEVRINGSNKLSASGANTKAGTNNYHDTFRAIGTGTGIDTFAAIIDDLYCLDGSGASHNDFLGNRRVVTIRPNAAGDSTQFTPDSGDNYARVNEEVCGDDADYVWDDTVDQKDLYNYGAVSGLASIDAVQVNTDCRETDAQSFTLKTVCKSGTTESDDAGQVIGSTNYVTKKRLLPTDPDTTAAWTESGLNAVQFGVKVG